MTVLDLFAGMGGWDVAAHALGMRPVGLELDATTCATRRAAGLRTMECDVAAVDLKAGWAETMVTGLIASPPCQAFSLAGAGAGRRAIAAYAHVIGRMANGWAVDYDALDRECEDPRAHLVLEPLRWTLHLRPRWVALEQVAPVLPLWEAMAEALRAHGYQCATGLLSAEQYGTPQTRVRAILLASLDGPVALPAPTHQRYIAPRRTEEPTGQLFNAPEPRRIVDPGEAHLEPWISMADALGWGMTERPTHTVTAGGTGSGGGVEVFASDDVRAVVNRERDAGRWLFRATNDRPNGAERTADDPAPALAFGHNPPRWIVDTGNTRGGTRTEGRARPTDDPAPVVTSRADQMEWRESWPHDRPAPTIVTSRRSDEGLLVGRQLPEGEGRNVGGHAWTADRPATTVAGDPRVHPPGHKENAADEPGRFEQRRGENAVRVTLSEALILQGFPPDYPVHGTKTAQFTQVGNAVPPPLAWHALHAALAPTLAVKAAA